MRSTWEQTETGRNGLPGSPGSVPGSETGHSGPGRFASNLRISLVIPAKNEAESLPHVLGKVPAWVHEVILVDGLSEDDTSRVAKLCLPEIRIVAQSGRGKGNALREGFQRCRGDVVVALDADGSMDPAEISMFVELIAMGHDYVKGSRMLPGGSSVDLTLWRRFGNWSFRTLTNILTGSRYSDLCYGYFAFRRGTIDTLDLRSDGFEIETEINIKAHKAGLRIAEVPSAEAIRQHGSSQLNAIRDGLRILFTILRTSFGSDRTTQSYELIEAPKHDAATPATAAVPVSRDRAASDANGRD